jgi:hypothetical protein
MKLSNSASNRPNVSYKIPCTRKVLIQINTSMLYRHTKSFKQGLGHHDDPEVKIDPSTLFAGDSSSIGGTGARA